MRPVLFALTFFLTSGIARCQDADKSNWKFGVSTGWSSITASDFLLNSYNYSGSSFMNFKLQASHRNNINSCWDFKLVFSKSQLTPENYNDLYYEYNNVERSMGEVTISYLHPLKQVQNLQFRLGAFNSSSYSTHHEFYQNVLYPYGRNKRKSYTVSALNLMPLLSVDYTFNKNTFNAAFGYAVVNVSGRPDDNYVKQIGISNGVEWKLYMPGKFSSFRYAFSYKYSFKKMHLTLEYETLYNSIYGARGVKSLQKMLLAGIVISR